MAFILTCIIILASVPALADTVTGHTDGAPIAAPIAIGEVERAALGSAGTKQGPRMKAALNSPSSNTDASPASRAKVWQVGAKRQLRYPSDAAKVANSSRLIDLPNCGMSLVLGNDLHQAATTENSNAIGYGAEGCSQRNQQQRKLHVIHNTFVNEARRSIFVRNFSDNDAQVSNNLIFGASDLLLGDGVASNNIRLPLSNREPGSWSAPPSSAAIDALEQLPEFDGLSSIPTREFAPPIGTRERPKLGPLDMGSRKVGL